MTYFRPTFDRYVARAYALHVAGFMGGIVAVIALFDALELLRRFAKLDQVDITLIAFLTLLKIPNNLMTIAPFALLFAAIFTLAILTRRQELVVIRLAGASIWQVMTPLVVVACLIGLGLVMFLNPLAAVTQERYRRDEARYIRQERYLVSLLDQGLWLRQTMPEGGYVLLRARRVKLPEWQLDDVMLIGFGPDHAFRWRYDGPRGALTPGAWVFGPGHVANVRESVSTPVKDYRLTTTMTRAELEGSFAGPETVSFWALPRYIALLQTTGLPAGRMQVYWGSLLVFPLLCAGLVLVAGAVTIRPPRQGGQIKMAMMGVILGFLIFFMTNFLQALGASGQIPIAVAAAGPALLALAAGTLALLILEDR